MRRITRFPRRMTFTILALVALLTAGMLVVPALASAQNASAVTSGADCIARVAEHDFPRITRFVDDLVSDGVVDEAQAAEIEARVRANAEQACMARLLLDRGDVLGVSADLTGTSKRQVFRALRNGESLAGYASLHGVSEQQLTDAIIAVASTNADGLVASGGLTREQADAALDQLGDALGWLLDREFGRWNGELDS